MNIKRYMAAALVLCLLTACVSPERNASYDGNSAADTNVPGTNVPGTNVPKTTAAAATTLPSVPTAATAAAVTTGAVTPQQKVYTLFREGRVGDIYRETYQSLFGRLRDDGFLQESLTGRYRGEYVRSIGAFALLAVEIGETAAAGRALRFVTDAMQKERLAYVPFTLTADGKANTADELDGRAHFVLGWARYITAAGDTAYFEETYPLLKREADAFCSDTYFYTSWGLLRNRRFTHTRVRGGNDYHDAFDLLTNAFAAAALEEMIAVAGALGHAADAALWQETLSALRVGIARYLTHTVNGKTVYLELRDFDGGKGTPEYGVSWVCLSPFAAGGSSLDAAVLRRTVQLIREKLWRTAGDGGYLAVECSAAGAVQDWILGKTVGWDLAAAAGESDFAHILQTLMFLEQYHTAPVYMEKMRPSGGGWRVEDSGNAEQVIWFLWGAARVRQAVGLSAKP